MNRIYQNLPQSAATGSTERDKVELLRLRARLLDAKDRLLIEMYLDNGASIRQLAALTGMTETRLARRINNLIKRLGSSQYIRCLRQADKIETFEMDLAKRYFLWGLSMRQIARDKGCSYHSVRKTISKIKELITETKRPKGCPDR